MIAAMIKSAIILAAAAFVASLDEAAVCRVPTRRVDSGPDRRHGYSALYSYASFLADKPGRTCPCNASRS